MIITVITMISVDDNTDTYHGDRTRIPTNLDADNHDEDADTMIMKIQFILPMTIM